KDRIIAINCRSGKRSKNAARILVKNGYEVIELDSGFNGWTSKGMPVSK
ncbi:MAG: rhodanese-like domain-containing protein, partial [Prevotella sp.]|nr:rhodanese-like domain-containing protein [Prevotella sp.]